MPKAQPQSTAMTLGVSFQLPDGPHTGLYAIANVKGFRTVCHTLLAQGGALKDAYLLGKHHKQLEAGQDFVCLSSS